MKPHVQPSTLQHLTAAVSAEPLWMAAADFAEAAGITERGVNWRFDTALRNLNGTRSLYERKVFSPRGGGRGGEKKQWDIARIAREFPGKISDEELSRARALAARQGSLQLESADAADFAEKQITVTNDAILEKQESQSTLPFGDPLLRAIENPRQRAWAQARASVIEPLRTWQNWRKQTVHGFHIEKLGDLINALAADSRITNHKSPFVNWTAITEELRHELKDPSAQIAPLSPGTLWRWWTWYAKGREVRGREVRGIEALADAPPKTAGRSKFAAAFPDAAAFFVSKVLYEGLSCAHAYDSLKHEWANLRPASCNLPPPNYSTCRRLLEKPQELPQHVRELAERGPQKYWATRGPSIRRERPDPMAWWVLDDRNHDVHVANDCFPQLMPGERFRPWVTLAIDWGSNCIVGYCFSPQPSSITVNSCLRMGIGSYGFPPNLYWDRGKNYQRVQRILEAEDALNSALAGRVTITRALPYNARAKVVEGHFATWSHRFDREFSALGAYAGRTTLHRPEATANALKRHAKFLDGKARSSSLPLASDFIAQAVLAIDEHNSAAREILGGLTPLESLALGNPAPLEDRRLLDGLFSERDARIVGRGGSVQLDKLTYIPRLAWQGHLSAWSGKSVSVSRDPYDLSEAAAYDPQTGQFLGELEIQPLVPQSANGQDPLSREGIKALQRQRRAINQATKDFTTALAQRVSAFGYRTELEARLARSGSRPLLAAAAPGTVAARAERSRAAAPKYTTFISDAVEEDRALFEKIEVED